MMQKMKSRKCKLKVLSILLIFTFSIVNAQIGRAATGNAPVADNENGSGQNAIEGKTDKKNENEPAENKSSTSGALLYGGIGLIAAGAVLAAAGSGGGSDANDEAAATAPTPAAEEKKPEDDEDEEKKESRPRITTPSDDNAPNSKPVGPDIRGDWRGVLDLVHGSRENVTASIQQNGTYVVITTSSSQEYGHKFVGNINSSGSMRVYDQKTGELWTTHEGPASKKRIDLYDYVDHYKALDRLSLSR